MNHRATEPRSRTGDNPLGNSALRIGFCVSVSLWLSLFCSCESHRESAPPPATRAAPLKPAERGGEPIIRVRVRSGIDTVRITGPSRIAVAPEGSPELRQIIATPMTLSRKGGQWIGKFSVTPGGMASRSTIVIEPVGPSPLHVDDRAYPGSLRLVPRNTVPGSEKDYDRFDAVNHVRVEEYLPGVLDRELHDHWEPAAYLAQAIAARSYAIYRIMNDGPGRHFDLESTQASQAYAGSTGHHMSIRAVADTVGLVLTHDKRILPAYYSSTCGGANQSAADAFAQTGWAPLDPARPCSFCGASKHHDWGPITHNRRELSKRIADWGSRVGAPVAKMGTIRAIGPSRSNKLGRPVEFLIEDDRGAKFKLAAESFRNACNWSGPPGLTQVANLKSSAFTVRVLGDQVRFTDGRGYGHGVGLCQYGAQGMAKSGHSPMEILNFYYPGAKVERAY